MANRRVIPQLIRGSISAIGGIVSAFVENYSCVAVSMQTAALSGHSFVFEVSNDAAIDPATGQWDGASGTWYSVQSQRTNSAVIETGATSLAATPAYGWNVPVAGWRFIRVRCSAHTSGVANYAILPDEDLSGIFTSSSVTLATGTALAGDVGVQPRSTTGGFSSVNRLLSAAASTNATVVKAGAGRAYKIRGYNAAAAVRYLKIYNKATAPTVGTDTPILTFALKPSDVFDIAFDAIGYYFSTGISFALTTGPSDNDTGALTAADVVGLNFIYI